MMMLLLLMMMPANMHAHTHRHTDRALQTVSEKLTHTQTNIASCCRVAAQIAQNVSVKEMARNRATHRKLATLPLSQCENEL